MSLTKSFHSMEVLDMVKEMIRTATLDRERKARVLREKARALNDLHEYELAEVREQEAQQLRDEAYELRELCWAWPDKQYPGAD